jgi:hypothetical protein
MAARRLAAARRLTRGKPFAAIRRNARLAPMAGLAVVRHPSFG